MRATALTRPCVTLLTVAAYAPGAAGGGPRVEIEQITAGPKHHIFGYIGHVQNIPWNRSGRYIVGLQFDRQDRLPNPGEAADVILIDTQNGYRIRVVDQCRAWNIQQGTMLYWNPEAPETQFFFNDRDPATHEVFAVLFDISRGPKGRRVREYRFDGVTVGNSGVAQKGGWFLTLNYGRLARLRPVTGYNGARDATVGVKHPTDDGIYKVNVASGDRQLIVSYKQLADAIRPENPHVDDIALFINHTLWSRDDSRIYFYARGGWVPRQPQRVNVPFTVRPDGTGLTRQRVFIGGHPEWETGSRLIGVVDGRQVIYDTDTQKVVGTIGDPTILPKPGADVALSPDGKWLANGYAQGGSNYYVIVRRSDNAYVRTRGFSRHGYTSGPLRNDGSPCWNRDNTQILFPAFADDAEHTRQLFLIRLHE